MVIHVSKDLCRNMTRDVQEEPEPRSSRLAVCKYRKHYPLLLRKIGDYGPSHTRKKKSNLWKSGLLPHSSWELELHIELKALLVKI